MVRILALILSLWPAPALAQAEFSTVISPTTLGTSPLAVTFGPSPHSVICVTGCAAGVSPSSVIVINQPLSPSSVIVTNIPTVSLWTSTPYVNINTIPTVTTSAIAGVTAVNVNNTPTVSLASSPFVQQGTNPWTVNGTVSASLTTSTPYVNINTIPTVTTSNTSQTFVQQGTNPWVVSWTSPLTVGTMTSGAVVNVMAAGTSALAVTPLISPMAVLVTSLPFVTLTTSPTPVLVTSGAVVVNSAAGTSALAMTPTSSPMAIAEQNGLAYPNRANWKQGSVTTTGTASAVVIGAPAANKLYITSLQCWRSDAGTSPMTMKFNDPQQLTIAIAQPAQQNMVFVPALVMSSTTSLQFSASTSLTSVGCNAQGYNNP